jgi:hypothetical protein
MITLMNNIISSNEDNWVVDPELRWLVDNFWSQYNELIQRIEVGGQPI